MERRPYIMNITREDLNIILYEFNKATQDLKSNDFIKGLFLGLGGALELRKSNNKRFKWN